MKRLFALILTAVMVLILAACGTSAPAESASEGATVPSNSTNVQPEPSTPVDDTEPSAPVDDTEPDSSQAGDTAQTEETEETEGGSHMLVAYFSLTGEQYGVGVIEEGNTSIIAHMIAEQTGADLFEIKPETPYPTTYQELSKKL